MHFYASAHAHSHAHAREPISGSAQAHQRIFGAHLRLHACLRASQKALAHARTRSLTRTHNHCKAACPPQPHGKRSC
eukprot:6200558-Pleurochrysis_carterae.AAC.1